MVSLDVDELCDTGAYPSTNAVEPGKTMMMSAGPYRLDTVRFRGRSVVTNLSPTGAYRGPGRSEAAAVLERAMDLLARELGLDPLEVRRRNLLRPDELPHVNPGGARYDESDYLANLDALVERAGYADLRAEQHRRRAAGVPGQLGIGVATVVDSTAWFARDEQARVSVDAAGRVRVAVATPSAGQRHADAIGLLVAGVLPVSAGDVEVVEGDTADIAGSAGTSGSRALQLAGSAVVRSSEAVLAKARAIAAHLLESSEDDIVVADGRMGVRGVPTSFLAWAEVAAHAFDEASLPPGAEPGLDAQCVFEQAHPTYTPAAHLSVVDVDVDTGRVRPLRHLAVTNCGRVVDAAGAGGQVVGASAQGVAQALYEEIRYDEAGNALGRQPGRVSGAGGARPAVLRRPLPPVAEHRQPGWRQRRGRGGDGRRPGRRAWRRPRRAGAPRCGGRGVPLHPRAGVAGHPAGQGAERRLTYRGGGPLRAAGGAAAAQAGGSSRRRPEVAAAVRVRGSPRCRSATLLRLISLVPP